MKSLAAENVGLIPIKNSVFAVQSGLFTMEETGCSFVSSSVLTLLNPKLKVLPADFVCMSRHEHKFTPH